MSTKLRHRLGNFVSKVRYWEWKLDNKTLARLQFWLLKAEETDDWKYWR